MSRRSKAISIALRSAGVIVGIASLLTVALDFLQPGGALLGVKNVIVFTFIGAFFLAYGITGWDIGNQKMTIKRRADEP
jgi:hypothetical protein